MVMLGGSAFGEGEGALGAITKFGQRLLGVLNPVQAKMTDDGPMTTTPGGSGFTSINHPAMRGLYKYRTAQGFKTMAGGRSPSSAQQMNEARAIVHSGTGPSTGSPGGQSAFRAPQEDEDEDE